MSLTQEITVNGKVVNVPVTAIDQLVNFFSPAAGQARFQARARMAISGAYTSADTSRRANKSRPPRETSADGAILTDLPTLREECQHLNRNNAIATGAIKTNITKVVGTGLKVKSQIDREILNLDEKQADAWERAAEREFKLATETHEIDLERQQPFSLLQALVFLKTLEDGDVFVNLPRIKRGGSPYSIKLQLIEAARVCNRDRVPDSERLIAGVKKDANGAPESYQVLNQHPGSALRYGKKPNLSWTDIKAFSTGNGPLAGSPLCLHLFDKTRPGQTRGVPYLAPVIELLKQLGKYTDAEVMAAVVSGMFTAFVTNEAGDPTIGTRTSETVSGDATDTSSMDLGYGLVIGLKPGESIETANPGRPNTAFDPFVQAILRQIGVALEIPFELLVKHFTASYSAARSALNEAWSYFLRRRHWLAIQFCQPVYEAVITEAIATGRLTAPGFFTDPLVRKAWLGSCWLGDAPSQIDPLKEINAAVKRIELTISTLDEESRKLTGTPWEDKLPQILKERAILRENGISISTLEQILTEEPVDDGGNT